MIRNKSNEFQKTTINSVFKKKWYFLDLTNKILGRWAPKIVQALRGKDKASFFPNLDSGNFVTLINAKNIAFTGNKLKGKFYYNHSGYPGGLRKRTLEEMRNDYTKELVFRIIWGMMPKTKLSRKQIRRLHIFVGEKHNLQAQEKEFISLD